MELALSTRVLGLRPFTAERLLDALQKVGVRRYALRPRPAPPPLDELDAALRSAGARAAAVLSAGEEDGGGSSVAGGGERRARAADAMQAALASARRVGARRIAVELGTIDLVDGPDRERELDARLRRDGFTQEALRDARALADEVARGRDVALERACRALFAACRAEPALTFGVVTPRSPLHFPDFAALETLLDEFADENLGYWHDAGAAHVQEALGLAPRHGFAGAHAARVVGATLHDVAGVEDHLPPGAGEIDFKILKESLHAATVGVLDVDARFTVDEVALARRLFE